MRPGKEINAKTQAEIGSFDNDPDFKEIDKLTLGPEDHKKYERWHYVAAASYQEEVCSFLIAVDSKPAESTGRRQSSLACNVC